MLIKEGTILKHSGKSSQSLAYSRKVRQEFLNRFGIIPESILKHNRSIRSMDLAAQGSYEKSKCHVRKGKTDRLSREFGLSGAGTRQRGVLSRFSQNVGRILCEFYCPSQGVVYDPFAGHNSRMELVFMSDRHYVGVDISKKFMEGNFQIREKLLSQAKQGLLQEQSVPDITLIEGSSERVPSVCDVSADFTITSPPYWDIEYYGDESEQLGKNKSYDAFLDALSLHIQENFRILKSGAYCCWCVNDFRKGGKFYSYHSDLIPLFISAGFVHFNTYIIDLGTSIASAFVQEILRTKSLPKRHEFCLVFQKPEK